MIVIEECSSFAIEIDFNHPVVKWVGEGALIHSAGPCGNGENQTENGRGYFHVLAPSVVDDTIIAQGLGRLL